MSKDKEILHMLIDKYERSKMSQGTSKINRRIFIKTQSLNKNYFKSNYYNIFEIYNSAFLMLVNNGFVSLTYDGAYVIEVILNVLEVNHAYQYLQRTPSYEFRIQRISYLNSSLSNPVIQEVAKYLLDKELQMQSTRRYYEDENQLFEILQAIEFLLKNDQELTLRKASQVIFGNSKKLEQNISKIHLLMGDVYGFKNHFTQESFLLDYGISKNPNYIYIKGFLNFELETNILNLSLIPDGIAFPFSSLDRFQLIESDLRYVLTVENLESYHQTVSKHGLIVYLGGFQNHAKIAFLQKLKSLTKDVQFYHFGDIDVGGFEILKSLSLETGIEFEPVLMDIKTLKDYSAFGRQLTEYDRIKLQNSLYSNYHEIFIYMLENNIKLEQEIVNINIVTQELDLKDRNLKV